MAFKEIGKKIQIAREEKGITQIELSKMLGITQAALSNYELGKRRLYLHQIEEIARNLDKPIAYFLDEDSFLNKEDYKISDDAVKFITNKISRLNNDDMTKLNQYIDFLLWRSKHE